MKFSFLSICLVLWGNGVTSFSQEVSVSAPLLIKSNAPGYVPEDYWFEETCKLYKDRVDIEYRLSGQILKESRKISGTSVIPKLLQRAQQEKLSETPNLICDAPSTSIYGIAKTSAAETKIQLYETGGCGSPKRVRLGGAAFLLTTLIGKYCSVTH